MVGQSNMHGALGSNITVPMPDELRNGTGSRLARTWLTWYGKPGDPNNYRFHTLKPYSYSVGIWGPEVFGGWTLASSDHDVILTKATIGGAPLDSFLPGNQGWNLTLDNYATTLNEAAAAGLAPIGEIDVLWWGQGESGINPPGNYHDELSALIENLKTQFASPNMQVVFMGLGRDYPDSHEADAAFRDYVSAHPGNAIYVSGKEMDLRRDHVVEFPDEVSAGPHYSAIGMKRLGGRMASATLALVAPDDDLDGDGLSSIVEFEAGTDPSLANTDGDQFDDGVEYRAGGDPLHDDTQTFAAILGHGASYDLYSSDAMLTLAAGQTVSEITDGNAVLSLQLLESTDLQTWTPAGEIVEWVFAVEPDHKFFKIEITP